MQFSTLNYLIKEGIIGLIRNKGMFLATLGTIVLSLMTVGLSYTITQNINYLMLQAETKFGITAYIDETWTEEKIQEVYKDISQEQHVFKIEYISKEEALLKFTEGSEDQTLFEQFKDDNPLPASFEIEVDEIKNQNKILTMLYQIPGLDIDYLETETHMFTDIQRIVKYTALIITAALVLTGVMFMSNTIKLTLYIRKKQINIMKYIGATNGFIRLPFLIEGLLTGLIGSIIPIGLVYIIYEQSKEEMEKFLQSIFKTFSLCTTQQIMEGFIPICFIVGIGIGLIGSMIAIGKHLDV